MRRKMRAFYYRLKEESEDNQVKKCMIFLGLLATSLALIALALYEPPNWQNIAVASLSFFLALAVLLATIRGQSLRF